jgi:superoxide dismutase
MNPKKSESKALTFAPGSLQGISEKTLTIHHDKLYAGYVTKKNEIQEKLQALIEKEIMRLQIRATPNFVASWMEKRSR